MDIQTLLSIRETKARTLDGVLRLKDRFVRYVELLKGVSNGSNSVEEVNKAQHELLLRLRNDENRFNEWDNGEQMLNPDVFGLAESPNEYLKPSLLSSASERAIAKFDHLVEEARDKLTEVEAQIVAMNRQAGILSQAKPCLARGSSTTHSVRCKRFSTARSVRFKLWMGESTRAFWIC